MTVTHLPALNAALNALSGILLLLGYGFIRAGRERSHRVCMIAVSAPPPCSW
ncbi:MAG: hypothetical protein O7F11_01010 [Acidobacteria bacterium]|nr:hypothetical protein [Acidobacteriota bacterium]